MISFSWKTVALKWSIFCIGSSVITFQEYSPMYLKQLHFSASQIGMTSLMGLPLIFMPLIAYVGDRFRARKLVLVLSILVVVLLSAAPLLPLFASLEKCQQGHPSINYTMNLLNKTSFLKKVSNLHTAKTSTNQVKLNVLFPITRSRNANFSLFKLKQQVLNTSKQSDYLPWSSRLFIYMVIIRGIYEIIRKSIISLCNVAVLTHIKDEKAKFGSYRSWTQIGGGISLFTVGLMAAHIPSMYCRKVGDGYFVTFPWAAITVSLSLIAIPWMSYEYLEHRVINWADVKSVIFNKHYLIMLFICFYFGWCFSFQPYWEYWYIAELSGTPSIMAVGGLIRRPFVAIWYCMSGKIMERLGELQTMVVALFLFAASQFSLSFIQNPWLVLVIDAFQSMALAFSYSALTVHFSKAGSKASLAVILGLADLTYSFGQEAGSTTMGTLFASIGLKATLLYNAIATSIIMTLFGAYLYFNGNDLHDYEKVTDCESESENDSG